MARLGADVIGSARICAFAMILFFNCTNAKKKLSTEQLSSSQGERRQETIDTSFYYVKKLLNRSSHEVAKKLGIPDGKIQITEDCDYLPSCKEATYRNGKYDVLYYGDRLKWLHIDVKGFLNKDAMKRIGFPSCEPTFNNPSFVIRWSYPVKGLREVSVFQNYILINVDANFNDKF